MSALVGVAGWQVRQVRFSVRCLSWSNWLLVNQRRGEVGRFVGLVPKTIGGVDGWVVEGSGGLLPGTGPWRSWHLMQLLPVPKAM